MGMEQAAEQRKRPTELRVAEILRDRMHHDQVDLGAGQRVDVFRRVHLDPLAGRELLGEQGAHARRRVAQHQPRGHRRDPVVGARLAAAVVEHHAASGT